LPFGKIHQFFKDRLLSRPCFLQSPNRSIKVFGDYRGSSAGVNDFLKKNKESCSTSSTAPGTSLILCFIY
jgi:hypothetical protein